MVTKSKLNLKRILPNLLIVIFLSMIGSGLFAQEKKSSELGNFKVIIQKSGNLIKLKCEEGCAWKKLSYSVAENYEPQAINQNGMTQLDKISSIKDSKLANFVFTLEKTKKGVRLKGIEGVAWSDLSFALLENKKTTINQLGMIKLKNVKQQ